MKNKRASIIRGIITFVLTVSMVMGELPFVPGSMMVYAAPETYTNLIPTDSDDSTALENKQVTFNGIQWYIIKDNSTSETAGSVTLLAADSSFGTSEYGGSTTTTTPGKPGQTTAKDYSNSTVKQYLDSVIAGTAGDGKPNFAGVASAIKDTANGMLYLLSKDEANGLPENVLKREAGDWWLRTHTSTSGYVDYVNMNGSVNTIGKLATKSCGVRPALQLDLSSVSFDGTNRTFDEATALPKEITPTATFTATGEDSGTLSGVESGMKYSTDGGSTWTDITSSEEINLTGLSACTIRIVKKGNGTTTRDSNAQIITVSKAATPNLTATQPSTAGDTGSIPTTTAHQKSTDGTNWTDCEGEWTDLSAGTYFVRVKASGTTLASDAQSITIYLPKETTPTATFTATGEDRGTLSGVESGMKYSTDGGSTWTDINDNADINMTGLSACTIDVVKKGNGTTTSDSDVQSITVSKAATPNLTPSQPSSEGTTGSIPTTTEHQKSTDGTSWTDCDGTWAGLSAGTYYVRVKASGTMLASDAQCILIFVPWSGEMVVSDNVEINDEVTLAGDTTLAVAEGIILTINNTIECNEYTLTVEGAGTVIVNGNRLRAAGIRGNVRLNSGKLIVTGADGDDGENGGDGSIGHKNGLNGSAGIGGAYGILGNVTINGGRMEATGGDGGHGGNGGRGYDNTGNGGNGGRGGDAGFGINGIVILNGGELKATAGNSGYGGRGGSGATDGNKGSNGLAGYGIVNAVTLNGGTMNVSGGNGGKAFGYTVTITNGYIYFTDDVELTETNYSSDVANTSLANKTVIPRVRLTEDSIGGIAVQTYTGSAIEPIVAVTYGETTLVEGTDYTVSYSNNINAGTAIVTVSGKGDYFGTVEKNFEIGKVNITPIVRISDWTYGGTVSTPTVTGNSGNGTVTYEYKKQDEADTAYESVVPTNVGDYYIRATIAESMNYYGGCATASFTIEKAAYKGTKTAYTTVVSSKAVIDGKLTLPALPESASYAVSGTVNDGAGLLSSHSIEGNVLTFSTNTKEGVASAQISIAVTGAKNYLDYEVVATITAKEEAEASITGGDVTKVYGDAGFTVAGTVTKAGENGSWKFASSDTAVAEINEDSGVVTIKEAGTVVLTAIYESNTTYSEANITLIVEKAASSATTPVAKEGLKASDTAQALVTAGNAEDGDMFYVLGSDDKIAPTEGWSKDVPTAKDAGTYYVWYKVVGDKKHKDTEPACVKVTIAEKEQPKEEDPKEDKPDDNKEDDKPGPVVKLKSISISENISVKTGETLQLVVTYTPADASDKKLEWKSSNTDIATVDASGNVKGIKAGYAVVSATAKDGRYTASCKVEVNPAHTDDNAETTWISEEDLKDYKIPEEKKPEYTAESIKIGSKNDSKEVKVSISMNYMDAVTYNGKALTPKTSDEFKFELKLDDILTQAGVSGVKAEEIFKVSFVGKSKDAGEGTFYAKVSLVPKARSKFKLTKQQEKDLKKIISVVNKVLKAKDNRVKFKINKASIAGLTELQVYAKLTKDGKLKLNKKDKLTGIKSVKYKKTPADAKYTTLSKKAGYSVEAVDINTLEVRVTGTKNYTGWTTVKVSK